MNLKGIMGSRWLRREGFLRDGAEDFGVTSWLYVTLEQSILAFCILFVTVAKKALKACTKALCQQELFIGPLIGQLRFLHRLVGAEEGTEVKET